MRIEYEEIRDRIIKIHESHLWENEIIRFTWILNEIISSPCFSQTLKKNGHETKTNKWEVINTVRVLKELKTNKELVKALVYTKEMVNKTLVLKYYLEHQGSLVKIVNQN